MGTAPVWPMRHALRPDELPGCVLWLRSDLGTTTTAGVQRWIDLSGQGNHVSQDTINDCPALSGTALAFTRADGDHLTRASVAAINDGYTIGVSFKLQSIAAAVQFLVYNGNTAANGVGIGIVNTGARWIQHGGGGTFTTWGNGTTNPETWVARHDGAGGSSDFCLNGAHQVAQALANNIPPTTTLGVGASGAGSFATDSSIYGVIAYSDRKSNAVTLSINAYLTALRNGTALPVWRPTDETNLVLWLERADRHAGSHVEQWDDQANAYDVTEGTAAQRPVLIPYGPGERAYLHFDGIDDRLRNLAVSMSQPTQAFIVAVPSESASADSYLLDGQVANIRAMHTTATPAVAIRAGAVMEIPVALLNSWHYIEGRFRGAASRIVVDSGTPVTGNTGPGIAQPLTIGARGNLSQFGDCRIAELIMYSQVQSNRSTAALNSYFASRYEI